MVTIDTRASAPTGSPVVRFVVMTLARGLAAWQAYLNRRSVVKLLEWDARMLSDIGLTPGDVRSAMAGSRSDDPSVHLDALWRERRDAVRATAAERRARSRSRNPSTPPAR